MGKYEERPRPVEAVRFRSQPYTEDPFALAQYNKGVPEWITTLADKGKLVPFFTPGEDHWRFNFYFEDQHLILEPGSWLVYDSNYRHTHAKEYEMLPDEDFHRIYQDRQ